MKTKDITGQRFGKLVVIEFENKKSNNHKYYWLCKCDCGNEVTVRSDRLRGGTKKSCGCDRSGKDLMNNRFGRLIAVTSTDKRAKHGSVMWICKCDCGKEILVSSAHLLRGSTSSCGCIAKENRHKNINTLHEKEFKDGTNLSNLTTRPNKNNENGIKGVCFDKQNGNWIAHMSFQRKVVLQKRFANKQDAIDARKEAEEKYFKPILEKYGKSEGAK